MTTTTNDIFIFDQLVIYKVHCNWIYVCGCILFNAVVRFKCTVFDTLKGIMFNHIREIYAMRLLSLSMEHFIWWHDADEFECVCVCVYARTHTWCHFLHLPVILRDKILFIIIIIYHWSPLHSTIYFVSVPNLFIYRGTHIHVTIHHHVTPHQKRIFFVTRWCNWMNDDCYWWHVGKDSLHFITMRWWIDMLRFIALVSHCIVIYSHFFTIEEQHQESQQAHQIRSNVEQVFKYSLGYGNEKERE